MIRSLVVLLFSAFLLGGCIDVFEETTLNKDGSGTYLLRYDLSAMLSDPTMREMMQSTISGDGGEGSMEQFTNMDTTLFLYDMLNASTENRDFWKKVKIHMVMSEATGIYKIDFMLNFTSLSDVSYMYEHIGSIAQEDPTMMQIGSFLPGSPQFSLKKKSFQRTSVASDDDPAGNEDLSMLEMFLSGAKYTSVYHMPGKVSSSKIPNATIDGNTVTVENSLLSVIKGEAKQDGVIKFK